MQFHHRQDSTLLVSLWAVPLVHILAKSTALLRKGPYKWDSTARRAS